MSLVFNSMRCPNSAHFWLKKCPDTSDFKFNISLLLNIKSLGAYGLRPHHIRFVVIYGITLSIFEIYSFWDWYLLFLLNLVNKKSSE